jgi:hypothetical protein
MINMETKRTAIPLSREDRNAKRVKIDAEEFHTHIGLLHTTIGLQKKETLKNVKK